MSVADGRRIIDLETTVAALLARVAVLEERVADTCACCEARHPSAPADDPAMAGVVEALEAGQSIRGTAYMLGLDRNKVARLRQRAITEGRLKCLARLRHDSAPPPKIPDITSKA